MENAIKIQIPVFISYLALEDVLKQKMRGEYIPRQEEGTKEEPYAQILDIGIEGTDSGFYDLILRAKIRILRTMLKREQVDLRVYASLGYDNERQLLFVRNFKLDSRTSSGFYNTSLEVLANKVAYKQIIKKARINLGEIISKEVKKANERLAEGLEVKGLKLNGGVAIMQVEDITAQPEGLSLRLALEGKLEAAVFDLISLMPPK